MPRPIHAVIISWKGKHDQARRIALALENVAGLRLTVVASHPEPEMDTSPGAWQFLPDAQFFGPKFAAALAATRTEEILLLIHADTDFADWPRLVARCGQAFDSVADLALWAPDFTWTPYPLAVARLPGAVAQGEDGALIPVVQTDGIVLALAPETQARLRALDCASNNLGWGIDWAALAWAYANGRPVLRDSALCVTHHRSRSYGSGDAAEQMRRFFEGLSDAERAQITLLNACLLRQLDATRPRWRRAWNALRGKQDQRLI